MATCPECDADIEVDEFDVDKGDQLSCPECGSNLEVTNVSPLELDRRKADHLEIGAAFRATELVALVDVELVDLNFSVAFRAGRHTSSSFYLVMLPGRSVTRSACAHVVTDWQLGT